MPEQLNIYNVVLRFKRNNRVSATLRFSKESGDKDHVTEEGEDIFLAITNALNKEHQFSLSLCSFKIEMLNDEYYAMIQLTDHQGRDLSGSARGAEMWNAFAMAYQDALKERGIPYTRFEIMIIDDF
jgi:hypothetical protein